MNDPRMPMDQMAERVAELAPVAILPRLAALANMKQTWADSRRRVNDSHALQMKALGHKPEATPAGDDMGDTIVTGDIQITQQPQASHAGLSTLGKLGLGAALLAGGAGAGLVASELLKDRDTPAVVQPAGPQPNPQTVFDGQFGIETK